ncbi:hypothetical protein [Loigolactobacillus coryniformis]|uniref:Uncharacterized protein n=1 Tax=Loigolactobacillus coryniformis TaxID=1610 RepID=A0A5B8TMB9_9LACO|nr:hypothetical protein [Loigolactobacillus coryniformis]QEA53014.1 hypothetical protein FGL77_06665 [Loigolactobacillus coryniformis]
MVELHANERLIIDQLLDRGLFTSTVTPEMSQNVINAITAFKRPIIQRRITNYLTDLLGVGPYSYQENLLLMLGAQPLDKTAVHVLLATLKTILNEPSIQNDDQRVVATQTVIRQVQSEVTELDEKLIFRLVRQLFVERYRLFKPERLVQAPDEQEMVVEEYWSISPDFTSFARCMVDALHEQHTTPTLSDRQRVNRGLLLRPFLSPTVTPELWPLLIADRDKIAAQWEPLQRFALEIGTDYALLLDRQRQKITAKAYTAALAVARSLGAGMPESQLNQRIRLIVRQLFATDKKVVISDVRRALFANGLATMFGQNVLPTAVSGRFAVRATEEWGD